MEVCLEMDRLSSYFFSYLIRQENVLAKQNGALEIIMGGKWVNEMCIGKFYLTTIDNKIMTVLESSLSQVLL